MFCKKCGKSVKDSAAFCPYCGGQIRKNEASPGYGGGIGGLAPSFLTEKEKTGSKIKSMLSGWKGADKKILPLVICGVFVLILAGSLFLLLGKDGEEKAVKRGKEKKEYSVVGEWSSEDLSDLGYIMGEAVGGGIKGEAVELLIGNSLGACTVTFSESGLIYISFYDMSVTVGKISYEVLSEGRMRLAYEIEIPIIGNTVTASYNANYDLDKDLMSLDFFGVSVVLTREIE